MTPPERRVSDLLARPFLHGAVVWLVLAGFIPVSRVMPAEHLSRGSTQESTGELLPIPSLDLSQLEESVAGQLQDMEEQLLAMLDATASNPEDLGETYGELGRLYHAYGLVEPAEACYLNAIELQPADFRWPYYLANVYQGSGQLDESRRYFERAITLGPTYAPALIHLGEVYIAQNDLDEAEVRLREALQLEPSSSAALAALGQVALSRRQYAEAVDLLERALELVPEANQLHYPLAMAYRGLGDADLARQHLAQRGMVGVRPPDRLIDDLAELVRGETIPLLRGRQAYRAGRFEDAAAEFRKAVDARPESARARINLGTALGALGRREEAIRQYEEALRLQPDNSTAHFNLARLLAVRGSYEEAIEHYQAAIESDPRDGQALLEYAAALQLSGRPEEAFARFDEASEFDPLEEQARLSQADLLIAQERFADARDLLEETMAVLPESGLLAHAMARLLSACPEEGLRDGQRALDLAFRVFEAQRTVLHAETVAMALAEAGRCDEAFEWQLRTIEAARNTGESERRIRMLQGMLSHYRDVRPCRYPGRSIPQR